MRFASVKIHMCTAQWCKYVFIFHISLLFTIIDCTYGKTIQSSKFNIGGSSSNVKSENIVETQYTNCRISSHQLIADAQTSVTRVLTGGCNAKTIDERFAKLEAIFVSRTEEIRGLIQIMLNQNDQINIVSQNNNDKLYLSSPRQCEIERYNLTLHDIIESNGSRKLFTYYWRISSVTRKLIQWKTGHSERSNTFYINEADYAMFMKFTPKYFPDGTIFVSVGLTKGQRDALLTWPFSLHLRIEILDHSSDNTREDRRSMMWSPSTMCPPHFWGRPGINDNVDNPECAGMSRRSFYCRLHIKICGTTTNDRENSCPITTYGNLSKFGVLFAFPLNKNEL